MYSTWRKELIPDVLNLLLGVGLFISPWLLGFSGERTPSWNAWGSGIAIAALALAALTASPNGRSGSLLPSAFGSYYRPG
jgi:hypothetical protein